MDCTNSGSATTNVEASLTFLSDQGPNETTAKADSIMDVSDIGPRNLPAEHMSVGPGGDFKVPFSSASGAIPSSDGERSMFQASTSATRAFEEKSSSGAARMEGNNALGSVLKDAGNELKAGCIQWTQIFQESEEFENFCPTRVDKLLAEAKALEENLMEQKDQLMQRLKALSQTLQAL